VQTCTRSAEAQHARDNDSGVGDWPSLERYEDIRMRRADHAANTTCLLLASPASTGLTMRQGHAVQESNTNTRIGPRRPLRTPIGPRRPLRTPIGPRRPLRTPIGQCASLRAGL